MEKLILLSTAPTLIILFYIYIRDKYEKEPLRYLFVGVLYGVIISFPISFTGRYLEDIVGRSVFADSFITAALVEEFFKFIILIFLVLKNNQYNEYFDGIVYAVFISLGFAGFENIIYVLNPQLGGLRTAVMRGIISVPAHALFGISMGHFLSKAKFKKNNKFIFLALFVPVLKHGLFDFVLMSNFDKYYILFISFISYLWLDGARKMKKDIQSSSFI